MGHTLRIHYEGIGKRAADKTKGFYEGENTWDTGTAYLFGDCAKIGFRCNVVTDIMCIILDGSQPGLTCLVRSAGSR